MISSDDNPEHPESPGNDDAELQRRLDTLRDLAEQPPRDATLDPSEPPPPAVPRLSLAPASRRALRFGNRALAVISAALCVVVIAVVALTRLSLSRPPLPVASHGPRGPVYIHLGDDNIACAQDAVWSPGGDKIAVFDGSLCGGSDTYLNIYDAASGTLTAQANLSAAITPALQSFAPRAYAQLSAMVQFALWTTQDLYISFTVFNSAGKNPADIAPAMGLLAFDPRGAAPLQPTIGVIANPLGPNVYTRWDLNGFTISDSITFPAALVTPPPGPTVISSLPPGVAYYMAISPHPLPFGMLSYSTVPDADPGGAIGNPAADDQISTWQPGTLTYFATIPGTKTPASIVLFNTSFDAMQPVAYLDTGLVFEGRLVPPDQPAPDVNALAKAGLLAPWLPIRDAALAAVLTDMEHNSVPGTGSAAIAWRPDGTRLAYQPAIPIGQLDIPAAHGVRIYDCRSGKVLATLTPPIVLNSMTTATNLLRWSPNGTKLMLLDRVTNEIVVWQTGQGQLPA